MRFLQKKWFLLGVQLEKAFQYALGLVSGIGIKLSLGPGNLAVLLCFVVHYVGGSICGRYDRICCGKSSRILFVN